MSNRVKSIFGLILNEDGSEMLLIKRRDVQMWAFPGGGVEELETPEEATVRECKEETGFDVIILRKVATYLPSHPFIKLTTLYICKIIGGAIEIGDEVQDVKFFPINKPPKQMPPPFDEFIQDAISNVPPLTKKVTISTRLRIIKICILHPISTIRYLLSRVGFTVNS